MFRRIGRFLAKSLGVLLGLLCVVYAVFFVINWKDRPPSETVLEFQRFTEALPDVPDVENAYVYMLGFAAEPDEDPYQVGVERMAWMRKAIDTPLPERGSDPTAENFDFGAIRSAEIRDLARQCRDSEERCAASLQVSSNIATEWLASEAWLLQRHKTLGSFSKYKAIAMSDFNIKGLDYNALLGAQRLWFVYLLLKAQTDPEQVVSALGDDLRFWRMVLASADSILEKMITRSFVANHFRRGNLILRLLQANGVSVVVPNSWLDPFGDEERDMRRTFIGDWHFARHFIMRSGTGDFAPEGVLGRTISAILISPFYQKQHLVNRQADMFSEYIALSQLSYSGLPGTIDEGLKIVREYDAKWRGPYNVIGDLMTFTWVNMTDYTLKVSDLEGARRAAVVTVELRSDGATPEDVPARLQESRWRNPYDGSPLDWDEEGQEVVFQGLGRGSENRHRFLY